MEEEVLETKGWESKREAFRGRGEKIAGKNFLFVEHTILQRLQSKQEKSTEEEEMKQQQRMVIMKDLIKKIRSSFRHFRHLSCVVLLCCERLSWPVSSHL